MFKVVEMFDSIQGEGYWAGTPMLFIRLSQCPVGKQHGICTTWDNKEFICDTGPAYKPSKGAEWHSYTEVNFTLTASEMVKLVNDSKMYHICFTGGEPFLYSINEHLAPFIQGKIIHIETSGTVPFYKESNNLWITLSPKKGVIEKQIQIADEIKLLVSADTLIDDILEWTKWGRTIFLQPVEVPDRTTWEAITRRVMDICIKYPQFRMSVQMHKLLGIR